MERLRELDREQDEPRSRTPNRRGIPRPQSGAAPDEEHVLRRLVEEDE